jgi:serine phosphatase RsbU (regulator of sigma subunit)
MGRVSDMDATLATIVRLTPILAGVDRCAILLWDQETETFAPAQSHGLSRDVEEVFAGTRFEPGVMPALDFVRWDQSPLLVNAARDGLLLPKDLAERLDIQEMLLLPLLAQGELLGAMAVDYAGRVHSFSERLVEMLAGIANQAAMVIRGARLVEAQREEAYVSMALLQVAEAVNRATDLEETLETVARITPMLVGVEACAFFLWDEGAGVFRPFQQYGLKEGAGAAFGQLALTEEHPIVRELGTGKPYVALQDLEQDLAAQSGFQMALPLVSRGATVGIMGVDCTDPTRRLSQRWMGFLSGIAGQAAIAVENHRLLREAAERERMRQELEVAKRIQASFLPESCPLLPGWDLASIWRSARQVGGDFYDFISLPGGRLGLVIADVADKGVPAALYMALSRTLVRTVAIDGRSPAAAIARANDLIVADARSDLFVTLFYAILEGGSGEIVYVNAGHVPPLVVREADGATEELRLSAMALGVLPGIEVREERTRLGPGDALVLSTDGIIEAADPGQQMFGWERLVAAGRAHRTASAEALAGAIDEAVALFVGDAPQSDDFTLVVAKRKA